MSRHLGITDDQIIELLHLPNVVIARKLGCDPANISRRRAKLIQRGLWKPEDNPSHLVPEGYRVKGKSVLVDAGGNPIMTWIKSDTDWEKREQQMQAVLDAMREEIPRAKPTKPPKARPDTLCNLFILTDFHLGMKAWHEETGGDDWDLAAAEAMLLGWIGNAVSRAPEGQTAVFGQLGDFLHWDGMEAVTPRSKHILDADTRFQKLARLAIRLTRAVVDALLARHDRVVLIQTGGNHDPASTAWLREFFKAFYEKEPRVFVDAGAGEYFCHEHGHTSLFFNHGDRRKGAKLGETMASRFREVFGRTKFSYCHTGHYHSSEVVDGLMVVEQHRTLAPKDSHAASGGWLSGRDAKVITYHREFGEVSRISVTPEMLK